MNAKRLLMYLLIFFLLLSAAVAIAQSDLYEIGWWSISSGSATTNGGPFRLSGAAGDISAGPVMTGDAYILTGGFWSGQENGEITEYRQYIPMLVR